MSGLVGSAARTHSAASSERRLPDGRGSYSIGRVLALGCALLGALAGALAPGPAYRLAVPFGEHPRGMCAQCGEPLSDGPVGWLWTPGRCPACRARLGAPRWCSACLGVLAFAGLAWALGADPALPAFLLMAALGLPLAWIDVACLRLPDPLVGAAAIGIVAILGGVSVADDSYGALVRAVLAGLILGGVYLLIALLPGGNLGMGDVKLAAVLGLLLGWLGWGAVLLGAVLPHLISGPVAMVLLLRGDAGRRSPLPLGPALLAGAVLGTVAFAGLATPAIR